MAEAHQIIRQVLDTFKGLPVKLERITSKSAEWWRSHGREPKTQNPLQSGNPSEVTHYMKFARRYEAAEKGAGKMLVRRVGAELEMEFSESDCIESQSELHAGVLKESFDVLKCLGESDFKHLTNPELLAIEEEGAQLRDKASDFVSHVRAIRKMRESEAGK
jgi:hypothetical protein